ncbi:MAG: GNAT family N-acetyltransferase [Microcoleus sp. PH2017_10_PVI_O_A]|nr:GNAT family N-acetyltransferase [Microcoleus sp. PH2017_10_PVI_O_A]MCC3458343.1 GNAT family N-acetyltransferase [Microcoleus sp. PH2017_11_PCY_U_A]MCC3478414.1 GNAT family N-acetyltransferase [Microcoleus sp. PH2017_12_PCY_D_A]MCC3529033.1 GNAT family N-acetyltransferase [Microcoleus sp. PH2017_21_RUC_O_A]MCC3541179.1 GNAT family N-acetyltransferase [Microcoleus sp. PH2017_22_RUC_O_B]MCC3557805.1 GNAT family N-acetyltransferase [Microcoleus sp. PH2017_27_LUM_O_A]TAE85739.1 MAG: GNAT family
MKVRTYEIGDTEKIVKLFYDTVHEVNIRDYTTAQVDAWAPANTDIQTWIQSLSSKLTFVAAEGDKIAGFGQLEINGHIDCFYCHKHFQRQGIGTLILTQIESKAKDLELKKIFTEASITARPFFETHGFMVMRKQEVERRGQKFINFVMEKII